MPTLDITVDHDGKDYQADEGHILEALKAQGHDVAGISPDGRTITFNQHDGKGKSVPMHVPTENAVQQILGYKMSKMAPANSDQDTIDPMWSAALQSMPEDPHMRQAYIEAKLKHSGIENPQVIGHGNEYHVFDPSNNKWHQITQDPGMNMTGLYSAGLALPHLIGSGVGGAAGGSAGTALGGPVGTVAGAFAGGVAGGAAGEAARQAGLSYLDSDYGDIARNHLTEEALNAGKTGLFDGAAHGALSGLKGLSAAAGLKGQLPSISKLGQVIGKGTAAVGEGAAHVAGKIAGSPLATQITADTIPYVSGLSVPGQLAGVPAAAVRGVAKMAAGAPESSLGKGLMSEETLRGVGNWGESMLAKRARAPGFVPALEETTQSLARAMGGGSPLATEASARDVLGNMSARRSAEAAYGSSNPMSEEATRYFATKAAIENGSTSAGASKIAETAALNSREEAIRHLMRSQKAPVAEKIGGALDKLQRAGDAANRAATATTQVGLRGIQGLGKAAQVGGNALNLGATITEPLELPASLRYGVPAVKNWWDDQRRRP